MTKGKIICLQILILIRIQLFKFSLILIRLFRLILGLVPIFVNRLILVFTLWIDVKVIAMLGLTVHELKFVTLNKRPDSF